VQDFDILEVKIKQVKKDFKDFLLKKESDREKQMLEIISRMIVTDHIRKDKILFSKVQLVLKAENKEVEGDSEIINYKNWLKEKIS